MRVSAIFPTVKVAMRRGYINALNVREKNDRHVKLDVSKKEKEKLSVKPSVLGILTTPLKTIFRFSFFFLLERKMDISSRTVFT